MSTGEHLLLAGGVSSNVALFSMTVHQTHSVPTGKGINVLTSGVQLVGQYGADAMLMDVVYDLGERLACRECTSHRRRITMLMSRVVVCPQEKLHERSCYDRYDGVRADWRG